MWTSLNVELFLNLSTDVSTDISTHIAFRPCTAADAKLAVPLIISSGPATFDYVFAENKQGEVTEFVTQAFIEDRMELGFGVHTAITYQGELVAVGALWNQKHVLGFTLDGLVQIIKFYGFRSGIKIIIRGLRTETIVKPPKKGVAYLGHLGVLPTFQGKGLGTLLVQHFIAQAQTQGFKTFALDVSSLNPQAQKLYERLGFSVVKANPANYSRKFGALVEHRYMEKE